MDYLINYWDNWQRGKKISWDHFFTSYSKKKKNPNRQRFKCKDR